MTNTVNEFELNYSYDLTPGVYKVRSIADLSWSGKKCILVGNDFTCFLEIPSWMKSHEPKEWEKLVAAKNSGEVKAEREKLETKILNEKRGDRRKEVKLSDLVSQGNISIKYRFPCGGSDCSMRVC